MRIAGMEPGLLGAGFHLSVYHKTGLGDFARGRELGFEIYSTEGEYVRHWLFSKSPGNL